MINLKYHKMSFRIRILLIIGFVIFSQKYVCAQKDEHHLYKVGVVDSLYSEVLKDYREIYVQVPATYNHDNHKKYPVVFILDGEVFLPTVSMAHDFYSGGFLPEMVIVGISNSKNRVRDLTTSTITMNYGMPFNEENGKAENFTNFIEKELIPYIENKYPVTHFRTLIGHSYGGLFTVYTLINHPELFNNYLAIDPSLDWDNQKVLNESKQILETKRYDGKSLFMSLSGQLHMQNSQVTINNVMQDTTDFTVFPRSNIAFSNLVKQNSKNGLSFAWKFYPRDIHGTVPFPSIMDGLISLFEWFQMENTDKINSFDTPKEELSNLIKYRAKKLQSHFGYQVPPYPEELLNMSGYMNMDMQQFDKAKMYFEAVIEYYPKSPNAYDSMADYYEAKNDNGNALKNVMKAYELSGNDNYKERIDQLKEKK